MATFYIYSVKKICEPKKWGDNNTFCLRMGSMSFSPCVGGQENIIRVWWGLKINLKDWEMVGTGIIQKIVLWLNLFAPLVIQIVAIEGKSTLDLIILWLFEQCKTKNGRGPMPGRRLREKLYPHSMFLAYSLTKKYIFLYRQINLTLWPPTYF